MTQMLESVKADTRIAIVEARRLGLAGKERDALCHLEDAIRDPLLSQIDRVAIHLAEAELLYLAGRYRASHEVFVEKLDPLRSDLPHAVALVVGFNRCDVAMALYDSAEISRFYDLLDEQHIAGIEHWDDSAMLGAAENAAKGRSYESLPVIWRELLRAYRQGRWDVFRQASRNMAEECLRIGKPEEAAYHAAIAGDTDLAKQIGLALLSSRRTDLVNSTIERLVATANLQRHFKVACALLQTLAEAIPNPLIDRVIDWVLLRCVEANEPEDHAVAETTAWRTVEALVGRASAQTAEKVVSVAVSHRAWMTRTEKPNQIIPVREEIIDAVNRSVAVLPVECLGKLADAATPLAIERQNFADFRNAVNLLSHIAYRAPDDVKSKLKSALYPSGRPIPLLLIQAAPNFGQEILNQDDQLDRYASKVAENIKRVVQRVAEGEEPEPVSGSIATWNSTEENRQLIVHLVSTEDIRAIARHRNQFSAESLKVVMESLLTAISNPDNLLDNKLVFIDCLKEFADCFDKAIATDVFDVLAPIVSGNIELSVEIPCGAGQSHPLSRVNIIGATVEQVTARALFVLACIEHCRPGMYGKRLETIVEEALSSDSSVIRQSAFAAVREIPSLSESTWMPLLLGTRDPDPKAASLAFDAIATKRNAHLTRAQWKMVVYSLKMAQISRSIELRRGAARAVGSLEPQAPLSRSLRRELSAIREAFSNDIAHTVRVAANGGVEPVKMH